MAHAESASETYTVTVDYSIRPEYDLLRKFFDWVSDGYKEGRDWQRDERCKDVPTEGSREVTFLHMHFNQVMTTEQALSQLDAKGLRPVTLEELVCFARKNPDLQKEFPIAGLGSCRWYDYRRVPYLFWRGRERYLYLRWSEPDHRWREYDRFLVVRK